MRSTKKKIDERNGDESMKIRIEEEIYEGAPEDIAEQMRTNSFYPNEFRDAGEYVRHMAETFARMTDMPCPLPDGSIDYKARALFVRLSEVDALEILED